MPEAAHYQERGVLGNIFIRKMLFAKAGDFIVGHQHNFDYGLVHAGWLKASVV